MARRWQSRVEKPDPAACGVALARRRASASPQAAGLCRANFAAPSVSVRHVAVPSTPRRTTVMGEPSEGSGAGGPSTTALVLGFATLYVVWGSTYLAIRI